MLVFLAPRAQFPLDTAVMIRRLDDGTAVAVPAIPKPLPNGDPLDSLRVILRVGRDRVLDDAELEHHVAVDRGAIELLGDEAAARAHVCDGSTADLVARAVNKCDGFN